MSAQDTGNTETKGEQTTGLWLRNVLVKNSWRSPVLVPQFLYPPATKPEKCVIVMRFIANLEKVDRDGQPYDEDAEMESSDSDSDDQDIQDAKSNRTYENQRFRNDILRGARHVKWTLMKILPNGEEVKVPNSVYLNRMSRYENDLEIEDEDGRSKYVDRMVPDGFNTALYKQTDLTGTKFRFELSNQEPFLIRNFKMDVMSALDLNIR